MLQLGRQNSIFDRVDRGIISLAWSDEMFQAVKDQYPELNDVNMRVLVRDSNTDVTPITFSAEDHATFIYHESHSFLAYHIPESKNIFLLDSLGDGCWKEDVSKLVSVPEDYKVYVFKTVKRQHNRVGCKMISFHDLLMIKKFGDEKMLQYIDDVGPKLLDKTNVFSVNAAPGDFYIVMQSLSTLKEMDRFYKIINDPKFTVADVLEAADLNLVRDKGDIVNTVLKEFIDNLKAVKKESPEKQKVVLDANMKTLISSFPGEKGPATPYEISTATLQVGDKSRFVALSTIQIALRLAGF